MISTQISRASAGLLLLGGLALVFASDAILPRIIPNFPAAGTWLGQLLAAAWLAIAALNWLSQSVLLGGIYGRPVVLANAGLYFITATTMLKGVMRRDMPAGIWLVVIPAVVFTAIYGWLLFRGPFEHDLEIQRRSP